MPDFLNDTLRPHLRIAILKCLARKEVQSYTLNDSILHQLVDGYGLTVTRDQVRTEICWLRDQGMVTVRDLEGFLVAGLTDSGLDIAEGRGSHPAIQRARPKRSVA